MMMSARTITTLITRVLVKIFGLFCMFWEGPAQGFLLGAADGAHEDAVAKFGSAGWANHGINSYSLSTIVGSILYVKKLYFNNVNGIYNNLHNWDNRDILLIIYNK